MVALATNTKWYLKDNSSASSGWSGVTAWAAGASVAAGVLRRQLATPTVGNERVFVCIVAGTTGGSEPAWTLTKGGKTSDNGVSWQECTGIPGLNGDTTNTASWIATRTVTLGQVIYDVTSASLQIASTISGTGTTASSTPTFSATAGTTTTDNAGANQVVWTSLGLASNFANWSAPHARLGNAFTSTWAVAGDTIFMSSTHAETQASAITLTGPNTKSAPGKVVCVSNATPTSVSTGGSIATTGANALTINSYCYYYGVTFSAAGGGSNNANLAVASSNAAVVFESCTLALASTNSSAITKISGPAATSDCLINFFGCSFTFGDTGQSFQPDGGVINVIGGSMAASGSVPTTLISEGSSTSTQCRIRDCDLSAVTGTLCANLTQGFGLIELLNCRLGSGVAMPAPTTGTPGTPLFRMHNCDSSADNYRFYEVGYQASIQNELTTINNNGANNGTTGVSWKITTGAGCALTQPYVTERFPIVVWNDLIGSPRTLTLQIAGSTTLTNADIWIGVEYASNASYPLSSVVTSRVADVLATPSNIATSSASWGGSPAVKQQIQVTFTPQMKGPVFVRIYVGKASATIYVDPLILIT